MIAQRVALAFFCLMWNSSAARALVMIQEVLNMSQTIEVKPFCVLALSSLRVSELVSSSLLQLLWIFFIHHRHFRRLFFTKNHVKNCAKMPTISHATSLKTHKICRLDCATHIKKYSSFSYEQRWDQKIRLRKDPYAQARFDRLIHVWSAAPQVIASPSFFSRPPPNTWCFPDVEKR